MSKVKIKIKDLYKIFGPKGESHVERVKSGVGKTELLEKHSHVLGLQDINLDIIEGKIQVIMGLSGSGKSTLIRHINRLIEPTAGQIYIDDVDVLAMSDEELMNFRRFKASMVFQKFALLPHRTVLANTIYGLTMQGVEVKDAEERAAHWLKRVGLEGFEDRYPAQLSGGMQQRVGLARALATDADILLMDEAFSALDPLIRSDMQGILLELQEELHKTIVFITHDLDEALRIGDDIAILRCKSSTSSVAAVVFLFDLSVMRFLLISPYGPAIDRESLGRNDPSLVSWGQLAIFFLISAGCPLGTA